MKLEGPWQIPAPPTRSARGVQREGWGGYRKINTTIVAGDVNRVRGSMFVSGTIRLKAPEPRPFYCVPRQNYAVVSQTVVTPK